MQVLPETASRFGIKRPERPQDNLIAGTRYLRTLLDLFDQRLDLALAAYNAGEGAVLKYQRTIPPYPETKAYVPAVLAIYQDWRPQQGFHTQYQAGTTLDPDAVAAFNRKAHAEMSASECFENCGSTLSN
jgi:soluble lytic murein transglycosylase-like protein